MGNLSIVFWFADQPHGALEVFLVGFKGKYSIQVEIVRMIKGEAF
jgi:hypothetical protein